MSSCLRPSEEVYGFSVPQLTGLVLGCFWGGLGFLVGGCCGGVVVFLLFSLRDGRAGHEFGSSIR